MNDEQKALTAEAVWPDPLHVLFRIGDAFTPGEPISEWVATVAMAANDLAVVNGWLRQDDPRGGRDAYLYRVGMGHFFEIGESLRAQGAEPSVTDFIESMGEEADGYRAALDVHARWRPQLREIRNLASFHYPQAGSSRSRLTIALREAADSNGVVSISEEPDVRRFDFADEITAALFTKCAGDDTMLDLFREVSGAIIEFDSFAVHAVAQFVGASGARRTRVVPVDPHDRDAGWLPLGPP
jgi:hypothetical protein